MALPKLNVLVPQDGYSFRDAEDTLMAKLGAGEGRFRLDHIGGPIEANISLVLSPAQYQYWRVFWRVSIARGVLPFLIDIVVESGAIAEYKARIIPGTHQLGGISGTAHFVQMTIEATPTVADDLDFDATILMIFDSYGEDAPSIFDALERLVNVEMPDHLS